MVDKHWVGVLGAEREAGDAIITNWVFDQVEVGCARLVSGPDSKQGMRG